MRTPLKHEYGITLLLSTFILAITLISQGWNEFVLVANRTIQSIPTAHTQLASALDGADSGLVGWWKFDEGSGTTAGDSSGNENTGTLVNFPTDGSGWVAGKIGQGLRFNGTNSKVTGTNITTLRGATSMSVSVWVKSNVLADGKGIIHVCGSGAGNKMFELYQRTTSNKYNFTVYNSGGTSNSVTTINTYVLGQWLHIVGVWNGNDSQIYINGVNDSQSVPVLTGSITTTNTQVLEIGKGGCAGLGLWNGLIDDVRIYNRALSADEISQLYALGSGSSNSNSGTDTVTGNIDTVNPPSGITNQPSNQTPIVSAGSNQTITLPSTVSLSGTASDDGLPTGSTLTTTWSKVSGPGTVTFTNSSSLNTITTFSTSGTYILKFSASDGDQTSTSNTTITVNPVADVTMRPPPIVPPPTNAQVIGAEALQVFPQSSLWNEGVNFRPGNYDIVTTNPPQFSWLYSPDPTLVNSNYTDIEAKQFIFQTASDPSFSALSIIDNIQTPLNFYNTLKPFNTIATIYWRVGYIHTGGTSPYTWSKTRQFAISSDAKKWDRSMLADTCYGITTTSVQLLPSTCSTPLPFSLATHAAHPHMLFTTATAPALVQYLDNSGGATWTSKKTAAITTVNQSWWPNQPPSSIGISDWASQVGNVAFVLSMASSSPTSANKTLAAQILAKNPQQALVNLAQYYKNDY